MPIDPRMVAWDESPSEPKIDPRMVKWDDAKPAKEKFDVRTLMPPKYDATNANAGAIRGAGSIGETLLRPKDLLEAWIAKQMGADMPAPDRRAGMDAALTSLGADTKSVPFQSTKLLTEVAGTAGAGAGVSAGLRAIPGAPNAIPTLLKAIETGGMSANGAKGLYGAANRVAGGAVSGAATAGAVNPEDATTGAIIGGAFPLAVQAAGKVGGAIGNVFGPSLSTISPTKLQTAKESMDAGYIIPPSMINPSFKNRTLESISGKHSTAQIAATKNQAVTERLVRDGLGLPPDAPLTFATMKGYRSAQHAAGYEPLRNAGVIPAGPAFNQSLDDITRQYTGKGTIPAVEKKDIAELVASHKSNGFDAGDAVDAIRILREDASSLFQKGDNAKAKATKAIADAYESAIESSLAASGNTELLSGYRAARQNIAKSATVEKAIREGSGTLDARILARELQKGKPLSGDIKTAASFANVFDKAAQPPHLIGSPDTHNLRTFAGTLLAGGGGAVAGLPGIAAGVVPYIAPPMARSIMFSKGAQRGLLNQPSAGGGLLQQGIDELLPAMYRTNPALAQGLIDR